MSYHNIWYCFCNLAVHFEVCYIFCSKSNITICTSNIVYSVLFLKSFFTSLEFMHRHLLEINLDVILWYCQTVRELSLKKFCYHCCSWNHALSFGFGKNLPKTSERRNIRTQKSKLQDISVCEISIHYRRFNEIMHFPIFQFQ